MEAEGTQFKSSIHADLPEGHRALNVVREKAKIVLGKPVDHLGPAVSSGTLQSVALTFEAGACGSGGGPWTCSDDTAPDLADVVTFTHKSVINATLSELWKRVVVS
jgi:hypothetical protein